MSGYEKISLFFGTIGLFADSAAIATFLSVNNSKFNQGVGTFSPNYYILFISISGLIIAYCWIIFSWIFAQSSVSKSLTKVKTTKFTTFGYAKKSVTSATIIIAPLLLLWVLFVGSLAYSSIDSLTSVNTNFKLMYFMVAMIIIFMIVIAFYVGLIKAVSSLIELAYPEVS